MVNGWSGSGRSWQTTYAKTPLAAWPGSRLATTASRRVCPTAARHMRCRSETRLPSGEDSQLLGQLLGGPLGRVRVGQAMDQQGGGGSEICGKEQ